MWFNLGARPLKDWGSLDSRIYSEEAMSSLSLLSLGVTAQGKALRKGVSRQRPACVCGCTPPSGGSANPGGMRNALSGIPPRQLEGR